MAVLVKNRIAKVPVSAQNAVEFLEITEQYKDLLNFEAICKSLSQRVFNVVYRGWKCSADVVHFWFLNQENAVIVDILFENCFSIAAEDYKALVNRIFK